MRLDSRLQHTTAWSIRDAESGDRIPNVVYVDDATLEWGRADDPAQVIDGQVVVHNLKARRIVIDPLTLSVRIWQ